MTSKVRPELTLARPVAYQIKVPGHIDQRWSDWFERMTITTELDDDGLPVTTLTGSVDQAALQGVLRRLYSLGVSLISVNCIEED